jgi:hypothetical protein
MPLVDGANCTTSRSRQFRQHNDTVGNEAVANPRLDRALNQTTNRTRQSRRQLNLFTGPSRGREFHGLDRGEAQRTSGFSCNNPCDLSECFREDYRRHNRIPREMPAKHRVVRDERLSSRCAITWDQLADGVDKYKRLAVRKPKRNGIEKRCHLALLSSARVRRDEVGEPPRAASHLDAGGVTAVGRILDGNHVEFIRRCGVRHERK